MKNKRTMNVLSYGFTEPADVLAKLERESAKLVYPPNNDDVFNFIITAAVLGEWVKQFYGATAARAPFSFDKNEGWKIPDCFADWITDTDCFPNKHYTMEREIGNVLAICAHTCNATKHYNWGDNGAVEAINDKPVIDSYYKYWFTSTAPDVYITYEGQNYGLKQIRGILLQFYRGLIPYLNQSVAPKGIDV